MIAKLKGLLDDAGTDWAVIDVGGVGYLVFCSGRTLTALGSPGDAVSVQVETHVREDHIHLYGFADAGEREWFRLLLNVQGVGAKVALAVLSVLDPSALAQAIMAEDYKPLARASGVGPRIAKRIVTELKERVPRVISDSVPGAAVAAGGAPVAFDGGRGGPIGDAVSALSNLGYRPVEAQAAAERAAKTLGEGAAVEALLRQALKELSS